MLSNIYSGYQHIKGFECTDAFSLTLALERKRNQLLTTYCLLKLLKALPNCSSDANLLETFVICMFHKSNPFPYDVDWKDASESEILDSHAEFIKHFAVCKLISVF